MAARAAQLLTDPQQLVRDAAVAVSRVGRRSLGVAIVLRGNDDVTLALAFAGALQRGHVEVSDALRSRFVDPAHVPLAQRDAWIDPVASGFVAKRTARALPVADVLRAFGVKRVMRHHICIGPRLVGGFVHASNELPETTALDEVRHIFVPIVRAHVLLADAMPSSPRSQSSLFTRRQHQIVDLVAQGLTNDQIATRLKLSPDTVKTTLHRLYTKVGARNRIGLVRAVAGRPLT